MISGKRIVATLNGVVLTGNQAFESTGRADPLDGQTGLDNGFSKDEPGSLSRDLILDFVQDTRTGFFVEIMEGTRLEEVKVFRDTNDNVPAVYMPVANVFEAQLVARVKERITHRVTIRNYGQYTLNNPGSG